VFRGIFLLDPRQSCRPGPPFRLLFPRLQAKSSAWSGSEIHNHQCPRPLEAGGQQQLTATGTFSDGSTQDLTSTVKWSSSDSNVTVVPGGLAKVGSSAGKVQSPPLRPGAG
jgi:hypothetical protein